MPKFSKLKMPSGQEQKMPKEEMDFSELDLQEEEEKEMPESDMGSFSDEELMAEVEKRGLMSELKKPNEEMPSDEESYS